MSELDFLQSILEEVTEIREIVYCAALWVVFALFWIGGKR